MVSLRKKVTCRAVLVLTVTLYTIGSAVTSVVLGTLLRLKMNNLMANNENDPEKVYIDECMRDFENLNAEDASYRSEYSSCIKKLAKDESLKRLPHVRLAVDQRVCDPADLCSGGDPGQCEDQGAPRSANYKP